MLKEKNRALVTVIAGVTVMLGAVLLIPKVMNLFHFATLHYDDIIICFLCGVTSISWFEIFKTITRRGNL